MDRLIHPLLMLIAQATENELVLYLEYLKAENRILRSKLPKRISVTPAERARLVKLGSRLGPALKELITIVHPRTFARWVSGWQSKSKPRKPGRPRKPEEIRNLIVQIAKDTSWGYRRILGELRKLRIYNISRSTVARILQENGRTCSGHNLHSPPRQRFGRMDSHCYTPSTPRRSRQRRATYD